jgi:hypothetical protein
LFQRRALMIGLCWALVAFAVDARGQSAPQTYKGLKVAVASVSRATNVSLTDCPAGANSVRGVIRPGDQNEFASVTLDFKVQPSFKPVTVPSPVLHDEAGKSYNTAQAFGEMSAAPSFSCTFSFRVPKGTKLARLAIDTLSLDLGKAVQK